MFIFITLILAALVLYILSIMDKLSLSHNVIFKLHSSSAILVGVLIVYVVIAGIKIENDGYVVKRYYTTLQTINTNIDLIKNRDLQIEQIIEIRDFNYWLKTSTALNNNWYGVLDWFAVDEALELEYIEYTFNGKIFK